MSYLLILENSKRQQFFAISAYPYYYKNLLRGKGWKLRLAIGVFKTVEEATHAQMHWADIETIVRENELNVWYEPPDRQVERAPESAIPVERLVPETIAHVRARHRARKIKH